MALSIPIRIDNDIYLSAKATAEVMDRSAAQQVAHWARLGRELEEERGAAHRRIAAVLAGEAHYDDLDDPRDKAIVRAVWAEQTKQWREGLDLEAQFVSEGRPYVAVGNDGEPVVRHPAAAAEATSASQGG